MQKTCFVISPIGSADSPERAHADRVWEKVLSPVFEIAGYRLIRSDKMNHPGQITQAIFEHIRDSDVCVADLSFLNPNVMYELGVRHCLKMPTIQIKTEETKNPFDTHNQRTIDFDIEFDESLVALAAEIQSQLSWIEQNPGAVSNPLTTALGRDLESATQHRLERALADLAKRVTELEKGTPGVEGVGQVAVEDQLEPVEGDRPDVEQALKDTIDADTIEWEDQKDGSVRGHFDGFDIALRPQSKGRWSSSAVHKSTGYSVTYPSWKPSREEARQAILTGILNEMPYWRR